MHNYCTQLKLVLDIKQASIRLGKSKNMNYRRNFRANVFIFAINEDYILFNVFCKFDYNRRINIAVI